MAAFNRGGGIGKTQQLLSLPSTTDHFDYPVLPLEFPSGPPPVPESPWNALQLQALMVH